MELDQLFGGPVAFRVLDLHRKLALPNPECSKRRPARPQASQDRRRTLWGTLRMLANRERRGRSFSAFWGRRGHPSRIRCAFRPEALGKMAQSDRNPRNLTLYGGWLGIFKRDTDALAVFAIRTVLLTGVSLVLARPINSVRSKLA